MAERPFAVIDGGGPVDKPFVCPWCGMAFERRFIASDGKFSLEEHWARSPECSANRDTNNPTQSKYFDGGDREA